MYAARLTFDDGPSRYTAMILDRLAEHRVKATFFVVGRSVRRQRALVQRAAAEGHTIGNHSWNHPHLPRLARTAIREQLERTSAAIADVLGHPPRLFRPPYGDRDERVDAVAAELGLKTVLWDVDPRDWTRPGTRAIAAAIATAHPQQIVLLHDGRGDRSQTVSALSQALMGGEGRAPTPPTAAPGS
jgi:peptidoglycan/xylan/chitin deacetylase (PgdA/CDA1 family)